VGTCTRRGKRVEKERGKDEKRNGEENKQMDKKAIEGAVPSISSLGSVVIIALQFY
jgi:hypothetical protein